MHTFNTELNQWEMRSCPTLEVLTEEARDLRSEIASSLFLAGGGHYGGALSVVDIILSLYRGVLRFDPKIPDHPKRDRFILSKGHAAIALYSVLRKLGFFLTPLELYGHFGSPLQGHPDMNTTKGIDFSTGSLGQGLSVGLGMAMGCPDAHSWVVLGDGECQEGQVWEAAMLASRYSVSNLHAVVDFNGFQEWGWHDDSRVHAESIEMMSAKWSAFGWSVFHVDGNDYASLIPTFRQMASCNFGPSVAIARTVKGKGFHMTEAHPRRFHCATLDKHQHEQLFEGLL